MNLNRAANSVAMETHDSAMGIVKCVVWDLDHTVWDGILLEDKSVHVRPEVIEVIRALDSRGILNSIASRNEYEPAMKELKKAKIDEYFLHPQINWNPKSMAVQKIADLLRLDVGALAFIDDQEVEREEVRFTCPRVLCLADSEVAQILQRPEFTPAHITDDARMRRHLYLAEERRQRAEEEDSGPKEEFLRTLGMRLRIARATEPDLDRVEELTIRTHQLNSTGRIYSRDELLNCCNSHSQRLLIASLDDRFGTYGKIGIVLMDCNESNWHVRLLLMSCRVLNRGVGTIILNYLMHSAREAGVTLDSDFVSTERNRIMYVTYKLAGFTEYKREKEVIVLRDSGAVSVKLPEYVEIIADGL